MKTFQHQVSYKQEEDQTMIKEGLQDGDIPTHIDVLPILTKENSVTFVYDNEPFYTWMWSLPFENYQLIIDNYIKKFPLTKDFEFEFVRHSCSHYHNGFEI